MYTALRNLLNFTVVQNTKWINLNDKIKMIFNETTWLTIIISILLFLFINNEAK